jgi:hypothetical protein
MMANEGNSSSGLRKADDTAWATGIPDTPDEVQNARARIPASVSVETDDHESVAKLLSEKLGLHEELPAIQHEDQNDAKGDVESG